MSPHLADVDGLLPTLNAVSWVLTILGICALVVLHELGHFTVAKAVGMRVERFSLFFPPTIFKVRRGETEYAIGAIPAGGYVKITGMNPEEIKDLHPDIARRAYYTQAPWKRIALILAGPGVNIAIAILLLRRLALRRIGIDIGARRRRLYDDRPRRRRGHARTQYGR